MPVVDFRSCNRERSTHLLHNLLTRFMRDGRTDDAVDNGHLREIARERLEQRANSRLTNAQDVILRVREICFGIEGGADLGIGSERRVHSTFQDHVNEHTGPAGGTRGVCCPREGGNEARACGRCNALDELSARQETHGDLSLMCLGAADGDGNSYNLSSSIALTHASKRRAASEELVGSGQRSIAKAASSATMEGVDFTTRRSGPIKSNSISVDVRVFGSLLGATVEAARSSASPGIRSGTGLLGA